MRQPKPFTVTWKGSKPFASTRRGQRALNALRHAGQHCLNLYNGCKGTEHYDAYRIIYSRYMDLLK